MRYKTDCPCYSEVNMGNPGGVPHCSHYGLEPDCENCKRPKRTKADRVRSMTDEELADALFYGQFTTKQATLDWLRQEATDADN